MDWIRSKGRARVLYFVVVSVTEVWRERKRKRFLFAYS